MIRTYVMTAAILLGGVASAHAQDAAAGEKSFVVCRACHQVGPNAKNGIGPVLNGVVGRKAGTYPGFDYSDANKNSGLVWTTDELNTYLENPQKVVPHTKMVYPGIKNEQQRKNVIAYLATLNADGSKKQ